MRTIYRASDGKEFNNAKDCLIHEDSLFDVKITDASLKIDVKAFIDGLDDIKNCEYVGTEREVFLMILRNNIWTVDE